MEIIILHDADARIEYLDVAGHLIGSDIEEFLTRQGFSVNNLPFPQKSVFFTHNLSLCLFLRLVGAENIPPQAE